MAWGLSAAGRSGLRDGCTNCHCFFSSLFFSLFVCCLCWLRFRFKLTTVFALSTPTRREGDPWHFDSPVAGRLSAARLKDLTSHFVSASTDCQVPSLHLSHELHLHSVHRYRDQLELSRATHSQDAQLGAGHLPQIPAYLALYEAAEEDEAEVDDGDALTALRLSPPSPHADVRRWPGDGDDGALALCASSW